VQRPDKAPVALEGSIKRRRLIASAGIDGDERIDRRAVLVKSLDARQIEFDQLARCQLATPEGRVHLIDCCLDDFEFLAPVASASRVSRHARPLITGSHLASIARASDRLIAVVGGN
jgi:hypothetical protein